MFERPLSDRRAPRVHDTQNRLSKANVLVADRDARTAALVHTVLRTFGFQSIDLATDADKVLEAMQRKPFNLIITEWHLATTDGVQLVKAIRGAGKGMMVRRDIPIIMLTAHAEVEAVKRARDAGITEFLAKPFSAQTLAYRLVQVIDNPRNFIETSGYVGPCRRRRGEPPPEVGERRGVAKADVQAPNQDLQELIGQGLSARDIFTDALVREAQTELQNQEPVFIAWANNDIIKLQQCYVELLKAPDNAQLRIAMTQIAYSIKSQAGTFGYDLGTQVGSGLVHYLEHHPQLSEDNFTVLRKYIDTIAVIFNQRIKDSGMEIGEELLVSLQKLVEKIG